MTATGIGLLPFQRRFVAGVLRPDISRAARCAADQNTTQPNRSGGRAIRGRLKRSITCNQTEAGNSCCDLFERWRPLMWELAAYLSDSYHQRPAGAEPAEHEDPGSRTF